jgi:hypothetical protein
MVWLWYFAVGLSIFLARLPFRKKGKWIRLASFLTGGLCASLIAALFGAETAAFRFAMPPGMVPVLGAIAGLVLFTADERKWAQRFWLRYFLTPLLGLAVASILIAIFAGYSILTGHEAAWAGQWPAVLFTFVLMGLLAVFGYTFPDRWFAEK